MPSGGCIVPAPRSTDLSWVAVAEWLCGTSDRHIAPRVPGSSGNLQRDAPAANSFRLCGVLQSSAPALGITERRAPASSGPTIWRHCRRSDPGWTAPPIRPDMIFGKDKISFSLAADELNHRLGLCVWARFSGGPDDCQKLFSSCRVDLYHRCRATVGPCCERLAGYRRHDNFNPAMGKLDCLRCCRWACMARF